MSGSLRAQAGEGKRGVALLKGSGAGVPSPGPPGPGPWRERGL